MDCSTPRFLCLLLSPRVISSSYLLSWWCYPAISFLILPCLNGRPINRWVLGQGIATLFRKPADQGEGRLLSQRTILSELEFSLLLYSEGREQSWKFLGSSYLLCVCVCVCVLVAKLCLTLCNPWTVACQASLSVEFSTQEYCSG